MLLVMRPRVLASRSQNAAPRAAPAAGTIGPVADHAADVAVEGGLVDAESDRVGVRVVHAALLSLRSPIAQPDAPVARGERVGATTAWPMFSEGGRRRPRRRRVSSSFALAATRS